MEIAKLRPSMRCFRRLVLGCLITTVHQPDAARSQVEAPAPHVNGAERPPGLPVPPPDPWRDSRKAPVLDALRRAFADPDPNVRLSAVELFGPPGRDLNLLFAALRDSEPRVWAEAVHWLWYHTQINASFVADLTVHLSHANPRVRHEAVVALIDIIPLSLPDTFPRLVTLLRDPDPDTRRHALDALGRYGPSAAEVVLGSLSGPTPDANDADWLRRVALAVWRIDPRHVDPAAWLLVRPATWASDATVTQAVVAMSENFDIGPGLAWAIANAPGPARFRALAAASSWGDRGIVVWSGMPGDRHYRPDPNPPNFGAGRQPNFDALRQGDVTGLVMSLVARLGDPEINPEERAAVVDTLGHIGPAAGAAAPTLIHDLEKPGDRLIGLMTASALLRIVTDEPRAVKELWDTVTDADENVGETALALLLEAIPNRPVFVPAVVQPNLSAKVSESLEADNSRQRLLALQVLPSLRQRVPDALVETLCGDVLERVRTVPPAALPEALKLSEPLEPSLSTAQRTRLVRAMLGRRDNADKTARKALVRELAREAGKTLSALVMALAQEDFTVDAPGSPELPSEVKGDVLDRIISLISDSDPSVRLVTLRQLQFSTHVSGRRVDPPPREMLPGIEGERQLKLLDTLASRLDDTPEIRQLALDLLVLPLGYSRHQPGLSDHAWQATMDLMERRLRSKNDLVRRESILALGRLAGRPAYFRGAPQPVLGVRGHQVLGLLKRGLEDSDLWARQAAAREVLYIERDRPRDREVLFKAWQAAGNDDAWILIDFAREFSRVASGTPEERAAWRLGLTAPSTARRPLSVAFYSPHPLMQVPEEKAPKVVLELIDEFLDGLRAPDPAARRKAALALSRLGPLLNEPQVAKLLTSLGDTDPEVRRLALRALWNWVVPQLPPAPQAPGAVAPKFIKPLWPPPPGYIRGELLLDALANKSPTWGDVVSWLVVEMSAAEYSVCYSAISGSHGLMAALGQQNNEKPPLDGFAVLTKIEQTELDGARRKQAEDRAELGLLWPRSFSEFWARLTGKPPGRYRMILFVLLPGPELPEFIGDPRPTGITEDEAVLNFGWTPVDLRSILHSLPEPMRRKQFGHGKVWVVIYDIERRQGGALNPHFSGNTDLGRNLRAAGLGSLISDGALPP